MCQCDWNQNLATAGTINWPEGGRRGFIFNKANPEPLARWNHNVAESAKWNHNVAVITGGPPPDFAALKASVSQS